jgi:hypothetical protein
MDPRSFPFNKLTPEDHLTIRKWKWGVGAVYGAALLVLALIVAAGPYTKTETASIEHGFSAATIPDPHTNRTGSSGYSLLFGGRLSADVRSYSDWFCQIFNRLWKSSDAISFLSDPLHLPSSQGDESTHRVHTLATYLPRGIGGQALRAYSAGAAK